MADWIKFLYYANRCLEIVYDSSFRAVSRSIVAINSVQSHRNWKTWINQLFLFWKSWTQSKVQVTFFLCFRNYSSISFIHFIMGEFRLGAAKQNVGIWLKKRVEKVHTSCNEFWDLFASWNVSEIIDISKRMWMRKNVGSDLPNHVHIRMRIRGSLVLTQNRLGAFPCLIL